MGRFTRQLIGTRRRCGKCDVCCYVPSLVEVGHKPAYTRCPNQVWPGCGIHPERPTICRKFECGWKKNYGLDSDRPDKVGLYMTMADSAFGQIVRVHVVDDTNFDSDELIDFVGRLKVIEQQIVVVMTRSGNAVIGGPEPAITRYRESLKRDQIAGVDTGFVRI